MNRFAGCTGGLVMLLVLILLLHIIQVVMVDLV